MFLKHVDRWRVDSPGDAFVEEWGAESLGWLIWLPKPAAALPFMYPFIWLESRLAIGLFIIGLKNGLAAGKFCGL